MTYLEQSEIRRFNELLEKIGDDTLGCWRATRLMGRSASLACDGNISVPLVQLMDRVHRAIEEKQKEGG